MHRPSSSIIRLLSWGNFNIKKNLVRGFNDKTKRSGFRKWMRKNKLVFGSTLETHVNNGKAASIISRVFPGWSFECNYEFSDLGKVWVIWHPSVSVTVLHKSLQSISCRVQMPFSPTVFVATFVYGSNFRKIRRELWSDLRFLSTSPYVLNTPWTVLGDFNQTLAASEHSSSDAFSSTRGMRDFINCTHDTNLADLKYYGNSFTWSNNQGAFVISKKLDRILVNHDWLHKFPNSLGVFGDPGSRTTVRAVFFLMWKSLRLNNPSSFSRC